MSKDTNCIMIIGNLTKDSETKYLNDGKAITKFSIANNGYKKNEVNYFDCYTWNDKIIDFLKKGLRVAVVGELKQERWTSKEGINNSRITIQCKDIQFLSSLAKNDNVNNVKNVFNGQEIDNNNNDIPF